MCWGGGVSRKLAAGGERELRYGFINVQESQASGNSFSSPVADKHVSGQCLCLRRRWVHYKVLDLLLSLSLSFTYCCCLDLSTPQLQIMTSLKIIEYFQTTQRACLQRRWIKSQEHGARICFAPAITGVYYQ